MEQDQAIRVFESLASGLRLGIYRLLMRHGHEGLVAGEIASTLGVPPTNLSFHLKALTQSGLLNVTPEGRYQRYRANLPLMHDLIAYLTAECCAGHLEQCAELQGMAARDIPNLAASAAEPIGTVSRSKRQLLMDDGMTSPLQRRHDEMTPEMREIPGAPLKSRRGRR